METKPDTIKISAYHREEIQATFADLFMTVRGSSIVSGNEAMHKAKEVSQLVDELTRFGIPSENIHLQGIHVETSSGVLLKSSSASYRLRVRCEKLDQIADLLDIIASQKNTILDRIQWKYPEDAARERGLQQAIEKAKAKANRVASSLGVTLLGVYDFVENLRDEERPSPQFPVAAAAMRSPVSTPGPSLGMDIQHSKMIQVNVDVWYRVSDFGNQA